MKLLLDENLSDRIVASILDRYPDSSHVKTHNLVRTDNAVDKRKVSPHAEPR